MILPPRSQAVCVPPDYFHHLHHRYFECNYGNRPVPLDKLFGTFHDGTPEAHTRMPVKRTGKV